MARNSYFRFKQFVVWQDRTALKVCTEACILGAFADVQNARRILDIGTGTGVLSLMVAQRAPSASIDAVEIDSEAYLQACHNVALSPFAKQISVHFGAVQGFEATQRYDLVVSNPPFYQHDLRSATPARNVALHAQTLSLSDLAESVWRLLDPDGRAVVLLPPTQMHQFVAEAAKRGLFRCQVLDIQNFEQSPVFRQICTFGFKPAADVLTQRLVIYDQPQVYTSVFSTLLSPYYLYL